MSENTPAPAVEVADATSTIDADLLEPTVFPPDVEELPQDAADLGTDQNQEA